MTPKNFKLLVLAVPQRKNIFSSKQINLVRLPPTNSKLDEITYNFWFQSWHRQKKHFSQIRSNRFFFIQSWKSPFIYLFKTIDKIAQSYGFLLRIAKTFIAAILVQNARQRIFINSLWILYHSDHMYQTNFELYRIKDHSIAYFFFFSTSLMWKWGQSVHNWTGSAALLESRLLEVTMHDCHHK